MYHHHDNDSSYAKTEELELSSKIDTKQIDENEEILQLNEKISLLEKNYITMERHYSEKIKLLCQKVCQKDKQFKRLQIEMQEVKTFAVEQRKKVQELNKISLKKVVDQNRLKSKSPGSTTRNSNKVSSTGNEFEPSKNPSPKHEVKKFSPPSKAAIPKRTTMAVAKNPVGSMESGNIQKNSSTQKYLKKSPSPKNSYQRFDKSKKIGGKVDQVQSIKMLKKPATANGISSFREKLPVFK